MTKTQEEFLEEILSLKKENPDYEIQFCIDSEQMLEFGWTAHKIGKVEVSPWWVSGETIYTDEEEILEQIEEKLYMEYPEEELNNAVKKLYNEEVKTAICVYTFAG